MFQEIRYGLLATFFLVATSLTSTAGIINFSGQFTSGTGSLLGDLPPQRSFTAQLDFDTSLPGIGNISSGTITFSTLSLNVTSGNIFVNNSNATDQATFLFNTSGPNGAFSVSFVGNAISDNVVSESNLNALISVGSPAPITANFGSAGSYSGVITAVPEPSSMALVGIGVLSIGVGLRFFKLKRRHVA